MKSFPQLQARKRLRWPRKIFDIVISDFHLPGFNGKELIKRIKSLQPATKSVLITAYQPEEMGKEEGALNAYLNKPIELRNLRKVLQELMT